MTKTLNELRNEFGQDTHHLSQLDEHKLDDGNQVAEIFDNLYANGPYEFWPVLLAESPSLDGLSQEDRQFIQALTGPRAVLNLYLNQHPRPECAFGSRLLTVFLCYTFGDMEALDIILSKPIDKLSIEAHAEFFDWAASQGRLSLVNHLIQKDPIVAKSTTYGNIALTLAANHGHTAVVERLVETQLFRQARFPSELDAKAQALIKHGLIRALWLELQQLPTFPKIQNFNELELLARSHLALNKPWMSGFSFITEESLVTSLKFQILTLRYYDHLNQDSEIVSPICAQIEQCVGTDLLKQNMMLIGRAEHLQHLDTLEPSRHVALNCFKQWSYDAHARRNQQPLPVKNDEGTIERMNLVP